MSSVKIPDTEYEQTLLDIVQMLPQERAVQLLEFARFLEAQTLAQDLQSDPFGVEPPEESERWERLLASPESQQMLDMLAEEALQEYRAGEAKPMEFDDEGRLIR